MLEVHPPHENVHTWRQFLIHIAAITIGLLIAIGLEQTVVYFHHRHQLQEARRELTAELEENRRVVAKNLDAVRKMTAELDANMALLHAAQTPPEPIGSKLVYGLGNFYWPKDATWQAVKQNGSLGLMAHDEAVALSGVEPLHCTLFHHSHRLLSTKSYARTDLSDMPVFYMAYSFLRNFLPRNQG